MLEVAVRVNRISPRRGRHSLLCTEAGSVRLYPFYAISDVEGPAESVIIKDE
jgi:hypothetical protein